MAQMMIIKNLVENANMDKEDWTGFSARCCHITDSNCIILNKERASKQRNGQTYDHKLVEGF